MMTSLHDRFYCGSEGYLSCEELIGRTKADLAEYARRQPLKWRLAMRELNPVLLLWDKKSPARLRRPGINNNTNPKTEIREEAAPSPRLPE